MQMNNNDILTTVWVNNLTRWTNLTNGRQSCLQSVKR